MSLSTQDKADILGLMTKITSIPSIIGSSVILFRFLKSEAAVKRNLSQRIIVYMSILDVICSINFFIGPWIFFSSTLCTMQGFIVQLCVSAVFWNMAHTTNILLRVVLGVSVDKANRLEPLYHLICWGIPVVGGAVGIFRNKIVPVGAWCWFAASELDLRFGTFYGWVFFAILYNIFIAIVVMVYISKRTNLSGFKLETKTVKATKNQLYYVAAFLVTFGPSSFVRILQSATGQIIFELQIIQALTLPMQGMLNCIIFLSLQKGKSSRLSSLSSTKAKQSQENLMEKSNNTINTTTDATQSAFKRVGHAESTVNDFEL